MPNHQIRAIQGYTADTKVQKFKIAGHVWVPVDDEHCMTWNWYYSLDKPLDDEERDEGFWGNGPSYIDAKNGFRGYLNKANDYKIDREVQRMETFTGIEGINQQDRAVQEAMGPIVDRRGEHLGQTDKAIIASRKLLLAAVKTVEDGGVPPGADDSYYDLRAIEQVLPQDADWVEALKDLMYPAGVPT